MKRNGVVTRVLLDCFLIGRDTHTGRQTRGKLLTQEKQYTNTDTLIQQDQRQ